MDRARLRLVSAAASAAVGAVSIATTWFGLNYAPRETVPTWLALLAGSAGLLALGGWSLARLPPRMLLAGAIAGAIALRLAALFVPVSLSDDVHRYLWDGSQTAQGMSPFAARPLERIGAAPGLDAAHFDRLNSPRYYSVYPPLAQLAFALAAAGELASDGRLPGPTALRCLFAAFDVVGVWALFGLLRRLGRPAWWALLYAWNPAVYWEISAGAHTEALLVPVLLLATCAALDRRAKRAGLLLGLAISAKLTAVVLVPLFLVHLTQQLGIKRAAIGLSLTAALVALGFAPFASETLAPHLRESLTLFSNRFSFNAPLYYALRDGMGYVEGVTASKDGVLMPALTAAALLWLALMVFVQDGTRARFVGALAFSLLGVLLFARVVHPWYVLPALALGVAARSPSIVILSLLLPLSYLRYDPFDREHSAVIALQFLPVLLALAAEGAVRLGVAGRPEVRSAPRTMERRSAARGSVECGSAE